MRAGARDSGHDENVIPRADHSAEERAVGRQRMV